MLEWRKIQKVGCVKLGIDIHLKNHFDKVRASILEVSYKDLNSSIRLFNNGLDDEDIQSHNLNFLTFIGAIIMWRLWSWIFWSILKQIQKPRMVFESARDEDFETVRDFDNWQRNDWDIQGQRQHIIFALEEVAKLKLCDCIYV